MNTYTFSELYVGLEETFCVEMTSEKFELFEKLSGDNNPLHCDKQFALEKGFQNKVMYGMAVASLYSTLAGVYLPGRDCLLQSVKSDFNKPVYAGDTLTVTGIITKKHETTKRIEIKAFIKNQNGEKVSKAIIEAGVI